MADTYSNHVGTTADVWQLGGDGPQIKRSGDRLQVRNDEDTDFAPLRVGAPVEDGDAANKQYVAAAGSLGTGRLTADLVVGAHERFITEDLEILDGVCLEISDTGALLVL